MTYNLGRAEFIIQFNADQALHDQTEYYHDTTKAADDLTKFLAKQLKVRESDVKNSASVMISEEKKRIVEETKLAKQLADDQKRTTQELLRINQQAYKEDLASWKSMLKERDQALKVQSDEAKKIAKQQVEYEQRLLREAAAERKKVEAQQAAAQKSRGFLGIPGGPSGVQLGGTAATLLGFGAIASTAVIAHEAIVGLTKATLEHEQAQRSLNAAFGATTILYKENAAELAKQFNLIPADVEQATTALGVLQSQTNLTGTQIRDLSKAAVENRAAFGGDLKEAHHAIASVVLGETEVMEKYGIVLQDSVLKTSDLLTESERRRFTTMSESEKQMIRYRLVMEHFAEIQGTANQQVQDSQGGFDKLSKAINAVAVSMGEKLIPEIAREAGVIGDWIIQITKATEELELFEKARQEILAEQTKNPVAIAIDVILGGEDPLSKEKIAQRAKEIKDREDEAKNGQKRRDAARKEEQDAITKADNDQRAREEAEAKRRQDILEIQLRAAHDADNRRIDDLKRAAEEQKAIELEVTDTAKTAELQRIEDVENARKAAHVEEVNRIKKEKDDAVHAADERKRVELERIETEQKATKAAAEENIRQLTITADALKKESETRRDAELERLETEKEARERTRTAEDRIVADSITKQDRKLDDSHTKVLRRIEREGEALHKKNEKALREIDNQDKKEEERHRKALERIDDEATAAQKAVDAQIQAIEDIQRAREAARRSSDLNRKLEDAQLGLRQATGTQDPAAGAAAQQKLISAIRIGDPTAIKKAQDELVEIVGHGDQAIKKAQQELSDAQDDIRDNDLNNAEDAQKEKLQQEKDRIKDTADAEKRLEDDRNRRRKDGLDKDKDAEKQRLQDALQGLDKKKEKEEDSNKEAKRRLDDLVLSIKRKLEDVRKAEDQSNKDAVESVQNRYKSEQDQIQETYYDEAHGYIPAIKRALDASNESYDGQREAAENRHIAERGFIDETFDHQLEVMQAAETEAANSYTRLVQDTRNKWEQIRKDVEEKYRAKDGKSGILDQYDEMKRVSQVQLDAIMQQFREHKLGLTGDNGVITLQWAEAMAKAKEYFDYVDEQARKQEEREKNKPKDGARPAQSNAAAGTIEPRAGGGKTLHGKDNGNPYGNETTGKFMDLGEANLTVELGSIPYSVAPGVNYEAGGFNINKDAMEQLIKDVFTSKISGDAANDAIRVWSGEGKENYVGDSGTSFGPFQLNINGLGKDFMKDTGNDLRDPTRQGVLDQVIWVADYVKAHGWNNKWHGAPGYSSQPGKSSGISVKTYAEGTLFTDPHYLVNIKTGKQGLLAERGPEMLLGSKATKQAQSIGMTPTNIASIARPNVPTMDYMTMGSRLAHPTLTDGTTNNIAGDTMNYYGVAPEDVMNQWRADQRRQRVLRGRSNVTR